MTDILLTVYQNFTLDNPTITVSFILWAMYAGLLMAILASLYNRSYTGEMVRVLSANECHSTDRARTLDELGIKPSALRCHTLHDGSTLRKYVKIANENECISKKARSRASLALRRFFSMDTEDITICDFSAARFYLPEDKKHVAEVRYGKKTGRGAGIVLFVLAAVLGLALVLALMYFIPEILELVDDLITYVKSSFGGE